MMLRILIWVLFIVLIIWAVSGAIFFNPLWLLVIILALALLASPRGPRL